MRWPQLCLAMLFYLYLPVSYGIIRSNTIPRRSLVLSVTLPPEALSHPEVTAWCARFRRRLALVFWGLTALFLGLTFLPWASVLIFTCSLWLLGGIVLISCLYAQGYHGLRQIKRRHNWTVAPPPADDREEAPKKTPEPTKTGFFALPLLLSLGPLAGCFIGSRPPVIQFRLGLTAVLSTIFCILCPLFHRMMFTHHGEELRNVPTRAQTSHWSRVWLFFSWLTALYSIAVWMTVHSTSWYIFLTVVYTLMLLTAALMGEAAVRSLQRHSTVSIADEDSRWIWGQFYYNPDYRLPFITKRMGYWFTPNFAHPVGRITAAIWAIVILSLPFLGCWTMAEEFSSSQMLVEDDTLRFYHVGELYAIPTGDIRRLELLEELPECTPLWATPYESLYRGSFLVEGLGECTVNLRPDDPPFLLVDTGSSRYLLGGIGTEAVWKLLRSPPPEELSAP